jgi:transcriptional regulator with XRE-family HTH domain
MTRSTHHPHYQAFLALLKAERKASGVTQVQLAEALGNRQVFVSKIENGDRRLDVVELLEYFDGIGGDAVNFVAKLKAALKRSSKSPDRKLAVRPQRPAKRARKR